MSAYDDGTRGRTPGGGGWLGRYPLRLRREAVDWAHQKPSWREARPALIAGALKRALAGPSGNWYVVGAARDVRPGRPLGRTVAGTELVLWRDESGRLVAGPGACPHLGAPLRNGRVHCGTLICHWHGLALDGGPFAGWEPVPAYDDGVLAWVRLDRAGGESPSDRPAVPPRPEAAGAVDAVYTGFGVCEPEDVVANRLDPWHGAWLHPYSFVDLTVLSTPGRAMTPVRATASPWTCPSSWRAGPWCPSAPSSRRPDRARSSCASRRARAGAPSWRRTPPRSATTTAAAPEPP